MSIRTLTYRDHQIIEDKAGSRLFSVFHEGEAVSAGGLTVTGAMKQIDDVLDEDEFHCVDCGELTESIDGEGACPGCAADKALEILEDLGERCHDLIRAPLLVESDLHHDGGDVLIIRPTKREGLLIVSVGERELFTVRIVEAGDPKVYNTRETLISFSGMTEREVLSLVSSCVVGAWKC